MAIESGLPSPKKLILAPEAIIILIIASTGVVLQLICASVCVGNAGKSWQASGNDQCNYNYIYTSANVYKYMFT